MTQHIRWLIAAIAGFSVLMLLALASPYIGLGREDTFFLFELVGLRRSDIVIVSSAASNVKGVPNRFIYGTTKAALNGFVKAIAIDHIKDGIRCNAILPGTVETPSWEGRVNMADDPVKARSDFIARQAMGRLAQPEEIASLATYLASDESDFVTGTLNLIDGGWTL